MYLCYACVLLIHAYFVWKIRTPSDSTGRKYLLLNYRCIWYNVSTHLVLCSEARIGVFCLPKMWALHVSPVFLLNSMLSVLFILTYSQMHTCIQNFIAIIFHFYCVVSVGWPLHLQDITLFTWLLRYIICFAGQNRWMFEANRSECSPYIYQQCYCFLYGCLNPYSCFTSIFTPSKFVCCFVSSYAWSHHGRPTMIPVSGSVKAGVQCCCSSLNQYVITVHHGSE